MESFAQVRYEELGNFVDQPYDSLIEQDEEGLMVTLTRSGEIKRAGAMISIPVKLTKVLYLPVGQEQLQVRYTIENKGQAPLQSTFASEWNFNLLGGGRNEQAYYRITGTEPLKSTFDSNGATTDVAEFHIGNTWLQQDLGVVLSQETTLWHFSIETVTGSEAGFERTHQGSCCTLLWPLALGAGQQWSVEITYSGCAAE